MQRFSIAGAITLFAAAVNAASFPSISITTNPTKVFHTTADFLPQKLDSIASCSNGTSATSGTASDIAILGSLLETNVTQELLTGNLYPALVIPTNSSTSIVLGSINTTVSFSAPETQANTSLGYNYLVQMLDTVRLCCAVSGFQYCDGTVAIKLGLPEVEIGGNWVMGLNVSSSGMSPLFAN